MHYDEVKSLVLVLADAINYILLTAPRPATMGYVKKSEMVEDGGSSGGHPLPEIEAQVSGKSVLLKILCEKDKGILVKILTEVENLNLALVNTSMIPFGSSTLDIKVVAEMDIATADIVKALRPALLADEGTKYMRT